MILTIIFINKENKNNNYTLYIPQAKIIIIIIMIIATCSLLYSNNVVTVLQWNPSKVDTIGTKIFVRYSEVSLAQGLVIDRAPPTIAASYDKALLWTTKMRDLSTDSS